MKKTAFLYTVLAWMTTGCVMAQHPCITDVLDTSYDGFMFNLPITIQDYYLGQSYADSFVLNCTDSNTAFVGTRYYSPTPIAVHGIAVTSLDLTVNNSGSWDRYRCNIHEIPLALVVREGDQYIVVDSARMRHYFKPPPNRNTLRWPWWPPRVFDYGMPWIIGGLYEIPMPIGEVYFDTPLLVHDTFYVGLWTSCVSNIRIAIQSGGS